MAYLVLANGDIYEGRRIGACTDTVGEIVFTTGVVGYLETLTDPSYAGQIIIQTFPVIGNYGVIPEDFEGESAARGYVVRELCDTPSNFRSRGTLDAFLKEKGIPGICGVDTRQLTRTIRESGVMNACICDEIPESLDAIRAYKVQGVVREVTCRQMHVIPAAGTQRFRVALLDYGAKRNILRSLVRRGCEVTVFPAETRASEILSRGFDGVMLSNGPGDPEENVFAIEQLRQIIGRLPVFGICLGHQLTALAMGGKTMKLKYGHRGGNQPVRELRSGHTYITSQNHGYAVVADSLKDLGGIQTWVNANDGSCEGIDYPDRNCFTVQFHPEACSGPRDTGFLFDRFMDMMDRKTGGNAHAEG